MLLGNLTGFDDLYAHIMDVSNSTYYIHGYGRFDAEPRRFAVEAALISRVLDSVHIELTEDGRLAQRWQIVEAAINDEITWLMDLPIRIYIDLGQMCAMSGHDLRHEVLSKASIVIAQIRWRVIDKMHSTHWYYT